MDLGAIATPQSLWLVFLLFLIVVYLVTLSSRADKLYSKLPSPPFKLPLIGHLHLVGSLPHVALRDLARKHGPDVMLIRLGVVPTLVVSSPRAAKAVLRTYDHLFASRPHSPVGDILFSGSTNIAFAPYGDYWRQLRKIVTTHLLSARKVRANRAAREMELRLVLDRVKAATAASSAVDVSEVFSYFANDVICQAVLGRLPREAGRNKMFRELLEINSKLLGGFILTDFFPSLARLDLVSRKAVNQKKTWDDLLDDLIDKHASKMVTVEDEQDFIDVLLSVRQEYGLTNHNIKAILMDMFEAGTDTTYVSLDYAMAELMRNPRVMTKLQAEVRSCVTKGKEMVTEEDLASMSYLKAVMKEAMRLHPSGALLIPHLSVAECDVEGYTIPSGTRLMVNAWALGRDPTCWENAEEFMPERFMEGAMDAACDFQGNDFRFLPFGSGRRICPGITFAAVTFEIILANLIYHFDWELPEGSPGVDMTEEYGIDVHRKVKLLLVPRVAHDL
ncbi:indole-2-monooxygenase [Aegilops tauschii subsp. strangulata]|uniref:Cytochrome P450 71C4 n=2 Tax=Aegilops tauschii subsp. strangulata TaxID=200361 RepID=A0A452XMX0_AEGTS|nr:indole-2-monooxygenase [Aegilops tauschii subsp. strangulata]